MEIGVRFAESNLDGPLILLILKIINWCLVSEIWDHTRDHFMNASAGHQLVESL